MYECKYLRFNLLFLKKAIHKTITIRYNFSDFEISKQILQKICIPAICKIQNAKCKFDSVSCFSI